MGFIPPNNAPSPVAIRDAKVSLPRIEALHPNIIKSSIQFIIDSETALNITLRVAQGIRSFAYQTELYNQGRFGNPGNIVTWSTAAQSYHCYGLAIDLVIVNSDGNINWNYDYSQLVPFAENNGFTCGINFPAGKTDRDHFQQTFGYTWEQLYAKYQVQDFIAGTQFVNI